MLAITVMYWPIKNLGTFVMGYVRDHLLAGWIAQFQSPPRSSIYSSCSKSGVPRPVTYSAQGQKRE